MTPKGRLYKPEFATQLLSIAQGDLDSARVLRTADIGRPENVCYHAHQVVEKAIKAILCHKGQFVPHTHDLEALVLVLPSDVIIPHATRISALTQYSTVRRYEEGFEVLSGEDLDQVLLVAGEVLAAARALVLHAHSDQGA